MTAFSVSTRWLILAMKNTTCDTTGKRLCASHSSELVCSQVTTPITNIKVAKETVAEEFRVIFVFTNSTTSWNEVNCKNL